MGAEVRCFSPEQYPEAPLRFCLSCLLLTKPLLTDPILKVLIHSVTLELILADLKTILSFFIFLYELYVNYIYYGSLIKQTDAHDKKIYIMQKNQQNKMKCILQVFK